jgi:enoyl-CoA hydratase/carnithine racemase
MFAGRLLSASEALRHGLVNQTAEAAVFDDAVRKLVEDIAALSPSAIKRAKHLVLTTETLDPFTATEQAIAVACASVADPDAAEGLAAFKEKRKPRWSEDR